LSDFPKKKIINLFLQYPTHLLAIIEILPAQMLLPAETINELSKIKEVELLSVEEARQRVIREKTNKIRKKLTISLLPWARIIYNWSYQ